MECAQLWDEVIQLPGVIKSVVLNFYVGIGLPCGLRQLAMQVFHRRDPERLSQGIRIPVILHRSSRRSPAKARSRAGIPPKSCPATA